MRDKAVTDKVLVYVVRNGKLLVFRHTDFSWEQVGIQVPAGSIRDGETPEDAALREAREETGLSDFAIVRKLGEAQYDISPYRFEIQHRHLFSVGVAPGRAGPVAQPGRPRWGGGADAVRMFLDSAPRRPCSAIWTGSSARPPQRLIRAL